MANGCHFPDSSLWHWFSDDDPYPPQMTGNEPRLEPTAPEVVKGKSATSWHFELSSRLMTSVFWGELLGYPVETNIVDTAKKGEYCIGKLCTIHISMLQWV